MPQLSNVNVYHPSFLFLLLQVCEVYSHCLYCLLIALERTTHILKSKLNPIFAPLLDNTWVLECFNTLHSQIYIMVLGI